MTITLESAVQSKVGYFVALGNGFSIYDITSRIRDDVNGGVYEIPECRVCHNYGGIAPVNDFDINHADVKNVFYELEANGCLPPLSKSFNGRYMVYRPTAQQAVVSTAKPADDVDESEAVRRISIYLSNCKLRNCRPTARQVRSAIKRGSRSHGLGANDILNLIHRYGMSGLVQS